MPIKTDRKIYANYNAHGREDRIVLGISLMALGELAFVMSGTLIKELAETLPLVQIILLRNLFGLVFINLLFIKNGFTSLQSKQPTTQFLRGLVGVSAMAFMVFTYSKLQLSEATLLKATTPIFIPLIALVLLHERVSRLTWLAITIAFVGVFIVVGPNNLQLDYSIGWLTGIAAAILAAIAKVLVRKLGRTDSSKVIIFYFALTGVIISAPFAYMQWHTMDLYLWALAIALAIFASLGQFSLTKAYTIAPAGKIGIYGYTSIPFASLIGWFIWQEPLSIQLIIGMLIIVYAGILNVKR